MSVSTLRFALVFALWGAFGTSSTIRAATFDALMQKAPHGANVMVLVNVAQILGSDYARAHDSRERLAAAFEQRSLLIPPHATLFVLAAEFDLERREQLWGAAVMEMDPSPNIDHVARKTKGLVETVAGVSAVGTEQAFILDLGQRQWGLLLPSNRQTAARWARQLKGGHSTLSAYLAKAGSYGDTAGTDIILAVDLADLWPQKFIAQKLRESDALQGRTVDFEQFASILAGVQGARLGIKIGEKCYAKLVVDLTGDPAPIAEFAKPLILEALAGAGMTLDDMNQWKQTLTKQTIALEGNLSDDGLRHLMSVVEVPRPSVAIVDSQSDPQQPEVASASESPNASASRAYFKAIEKEVDSLRLKRGDAKTLGQIAQWVENSARRIDRMSTLNVDDELLDYGAQTADQLRQVTAAIRGGGIRSAQRSAGTYSGYGYDDGYARRQARAEERATGATSTMEITQQMASASAAIRRKMTDRYKIDF